MLARTLWSAVKETDLAKLDQADSTGDWDGQDFVSMIYMLTARVDRLWDIFHGKDRSVAHEGVPR